MQLTQLKVIDPGGRGGGLFTSGVTTPSVDSPNPQHYYYPWMSLVDSH
jgi:hypothetical protein